MHQKISDLDNFGKAFISAACSRSTRGSNWRFNRISISGLGSARQRPNSFEKAFPPLGVPNEN
jgi:hypothetical protein